MSSVVLMSLVEPLQDIPSSDPVDQCDKDIWETMGAGDERSVSRPPTTEEGVPVAAQQETGIMESRASVQE
jgi:hypothetical protein